MGLPDRKAPSRMVRGSAGSDSEEERHDRFRSERNSSALKSTTSLFSSGLDSKKSPLRRLDSPIRDSKYRRERSRERRRSRERKKSKDRDRKKERSKRSDRSSSRTTPTYYNVLEELNPGRRSESRRSHSQHREERSRSRRSRERRSRSRHSDGMTKSKSHKHKDRDHVDTFVEERFERRRPSDSEERVDKTVVYWESTPSPEREPRKHKKRNKDDKKRNKDKKKRKEEKSTVSESVDFGPVLPPRLELRSETSEDEIVQNNLDRKEPHIKKKSKSSPKNSETDKKKKRKKDLSQSPPKKLKEKSLEPKVEEPEEQKQLKDDVLSSHSSPKSPSLEIPKEKSICANNSTDCNNTQPSVGPQMPTQEEENTNIYGPVIPINSVKQDQDGDSSLEEGELVTSPVKPKVYGPTFPERLAIEPVRDDDGDEDLYGPALPPSLKHDEIVQQSENNEEDFGPLPQGVDGGRALRDLERRAAIIKAQMDNKDTDEGEETKREAWMTELPEARRVALGLGPRKFRAREGPDMNDRSSWSDTPAQKEKKKLLSAFGEEENDPDESRRLEIEERDKEMEKRAKQGKKRDKSLLELHQKEQKKKKKKEEKERDGKKEDRRPFSRDIDLQVNRFDEAQKKSIIRKAQLLDSRFSSGETKYL
ncbi:RNA-binding protein 25 isoform X1 [Cimex lectularius]|uniref:DUF3752 domain-containing protein n=2 Tax=Cimex lectularius TaxID=79782 RepID=A0A8I6RA55_CIMLE|nr:RNA-binding protein 25 isoform X1 [Cimex lectularius]XP_014242101.1 RNA-binding protein 25 isoform X1 [Cimex lectularius]